MDLGSLERGGDGGSVRLQHLGPADEKGYWAIPGLATGTYRVTIAHPGFKTQVMPDVKLDAGVPATVNVTLEVGALTETVEVTAGMIEISWTPPSGGNRILRS